MTTARVGISDCTLEFGTWVLPERLKAGKIIATSRSCSPTRRKHESFGTLSEKNRSRRKADGKRESQPLTSLAGELCDCRGVSHTHQLPPSPGLGVRKFQRNVAAAESPAHGEET